MSRKLCIQLTWFHLIAHLLVFSASLRGNEHTNVERAALIYSGIGTNSACTVKNYRCSFLHVIFFLLRIYWGVK